MISKSWIIPTTLLYISIFLLAITFFVSILHPDYTHETYLRLKGIIFVFSLYTLSITVPLNTLLNYRLAKFYFPDYPHIDILIAVTFLFPYTTIYTLYKICKNMGQDVTVNLVLSIISLGLYTSIWLYELLRAI